MFVRRHIRQLQLIFDVMDQRVGLEKR